MATQTLEFGYTTDQTLTAQLFAIGSDTVLATANSVTEATNRKGRYFADFEDLSIGTYLMVYFLAGTASGSEVYRLTGTGTATIQPESETVFKQRFDTNEAYLLSLITELATPYGEPSDAPGVSETLPEKVGYLYSALRNQIDVTASAKTFYDDSGSALWSKVLSDDGNTYSEAEGS